MTTPTSKPRPRFVPSEDVGAVTEWRFSAVGDWNGSQAALESAVEVEPEPTVEELILHAQEVAYQEGFLHAKNETSREWQMRMDDYATGLGRETAQHLQVLAANADAAMESVSQNMAQEILALACDIARQVVRRELRADTESLKPVVQQALDMLVIDLKPAAVRVHPSSLELIQKSFPPESGGPAIQWIADPALQPDDCLVSAGGATVDGTIERRWSKAVGALGLTSPWAQEGPHGS